MSCRVQHACVLVCIPLYYLHTDIVQVIDEEYFVFPACIKREKLLIKFWEFLLSFNAESFVFCPLLQVHKAKFHLVFCLGKIFCLSP